MTNITRILGLLNRQAVRGVGFEVRKGAILLLGFDIKRIYVYWYSTENVQGIDKLWSDTITA